MAQGGVEFSALEQMKTSEGLPADIVDDPLNHRSFAIGSAAWDRDTRGLERDPPP